LAGLGKTWDRIQEGDPWWLAGAFFLECLSFAGYIVLFRTVFTRGETRIEWRESYQITMAGLAATRLFATAGAGGVVLTAWELRRPAVARAALGPDAGHDPGIGGDRRAHGAALGRLPGPRCARRDRLVVLRHRRAVGVLSRLRRGSAVPGDRDGLLHRPARQRAPAARRHRRRGRRTDRRVRGLRRLLRGRPGGGADLPRLLLLAAHDPRDDRLSSAAQDGQGVEHRGARARRRA